MKVKIVREIDITHINGNELGEILRESLFINDGNEEIYTGDPNYKEVGCYETFKVFSNTIKLDLKTIKKYLNSIQEKYHKYQYYYGYSFIFYGIKIICIWYWNGDGTLIFILPDRKIINAACECDYNWEEIDFPKP